MITGGHGNDPTSTSTDHSREFVPLLMFPAYSAERLNLGTRRTFSDIACTITDFHGLETNFPGKSMLKRE